MPSEAVSKFWEQTRSKLDEVEINAKVEPVEQTDVFTMEGGVKTRTIYGVTMSSFEGTRIRGWYVVPAGDPPKRGWPAILQVPGYGGTMPLPLHLTMYGYATLSLYPRGQAESAKEWTIDHDTWVTWNITDKDRYFYRGGYMDCVRGIDFLDSRPEIDSASLGVYGFSQGGDCPSPPQPWTGVSELPLPVFLGCATSRSWWTAPRHPTRRSMTTWSSIRSSARTLWPRWSTSTTLAWQTRSSVPPWYIAPPSTRCTPALGLTRVREDPCPEGYFGIS